MQAFRKSVALLATCQALLFANNATLISVNALAGYALTETKSLATLPVTFWVCGAAAATLPASLLMRRLGRRGGFYLGSVLGFKEEIRSLPRHEVWTGVIISGLGGLVGAALLMLTPAKLFSGLVPWLLLATE